MSPLFWLDRLMSELRSKRPENIGPKMPRSERAKQFAPFAALGRMDRLLRSVEKRRDTQDLEHEAWFGDISNEELELLAAENITDMEAAAEDNNG